MSDFQDLGKDKISKLIVQQAVPASVGFFVLSVYMIVDTIFVSYWVDPLGIAAITVVSPISFLISSIGMAIGIGGSSIIARALGSGEKDKANATFGNQILATLLLSVVFVLLGFGFESIVLEAFGAKGEIVGFATDYYRVIMLGVPFLAFAMMSNSNIRAVGFPKNAMVIMLVPSLINIVLDPIFIKVLDMGMAGAAWATVISYMISTGYALYFFLKKKSGLHFAWHNLTPNVPIMKEMGALGFVTLARQGTISLLSIVLNHSLYHYGGAIYVSVFGLINRVMMFSLFPILGITQGIIPIAGFNYGAKAFGRVKEVILKSIGYGTMVSIFIYTNILLFKEPIVRLFTDDPELLRITPNALLLVFMATPVILVQLIGSAYFQAIGKAVPALLLTLTKQGFCLIPLVLLMPLFFGVEGIWYAFPLADVIATAITGWFLNKGLKKMTSEAKA